MTDTKSQETNRPTTRAAPLLAVTEHARLHNLGLPGRTKRALEEPMTVSLQKTGGVYRVRKQSGATYLVDVLAASCTCPDRHPRCKHRRRVERELALDRLPTPDGRLPHPE